jgi:5-methylcytosine-specific restriction endonuclease McrA
MRVDDPLRHQVAERARFRCEYCHFPGEYAPSAFECDHIHPKDGGGLTAWDNLALACPHCNGHKAARSQVIDPATQSVSRLFNPRLDGWEEHFWLNRETGEIEGLTPIGRATVEALKMNLPQPVQARRHLIRWGAL